MIIQDSKKETAQSNIAILNMLCVGKTYKEISKALFISHSRIIWRILEMRFKNECSNVVALCVKYTLATQPGSEIEFFI